MARDRGLVIAFTGDGKGKTTAALGIALRASGHKKRTLFLQFLKGRQRSGEQLLDGTAAAFIEVRAFGAGFLKEGEDPAVHRKVANRGWQAAQEELASGGADILILDEISHAVNHGLLSAEMVAQEIRDRRKALHVFLTGRDMPRELLDLADTVTEMKEVRHAYRSGIKAIKGIDY